MLSLPASPSGRSFQEELQRCICTSPDCERNCSIAEFAEIIRERMVQTDEEHRVETTFREQATLSSILKAARGDWNQIFRETAMEMNIHFNFWKKSVERSTIMMQYIYVCIMGVYRNGRNRMLHRFLRDEKGQILPCNGDYIQKIIVNPSFGFRRMFESCLRLIQNEKRRVDFTAGMLHEITGVLCRRVSQTGRHNDNLMGMLEEGVVPHIEKVASMNTFLWQTFQVYHVKSINYMTAIGNMIAINAAKLQTMQDMHEAVLENWGNFERIPEDLHPRKFQMLFEKD